MKIITIIFLLFSVLHILLVLTMPSLSPESSFPYKDLLYKYFSLYPFTPFANFDGYQYISIAKNGYNELQQSYFPLYPLLITIVYLPSQFLINNYLFAGILVSWIFFFLGLLYFYKLAMLLLKNHGNAVWAVILLAAFPTAFFYQMVYTESLFLFLSAAALYYLFSKKLLWAAIFVVFASLTKIQGVMLVIPFLLTLFDYRTFRSKLILSDWKKLLVALAPLYGLLIYSGYLFITQGDPLYYYHAQSAFGAERSVDKIILLPQVLFRYIKIFLTTPMSFTFWISVFEFAVCVSFVTVIGYELYRLIRQKKKDVEILSLQAYSLIVLLLPTLTGTLTSVPRYALVSFGFFLILARIQHRFVKVLLTILFLALHMLLFVSFLSGYFVG